MFVLGSEHDLSKRTTLYAVAAYVINDDKAALSLLGGKYGANVEPGKNQFGLNLTCGTGLNAPESGGAAIAVRGLRHAYNGHTVLDGVDLDVPAGTVLARGPSCGKSTLPRLAGLLRPQSGSIRIGGQTRSTAAATIHPKRAAWAWCSRTTHYGHMSVAQNVGFPLEMRGVPRRAARAGAEALALVGLEALAGRRPSELSGGQQQRVALARAIVGRPRLLLDEAVQPGPRPARDALRRDRRAAAPPGRHPPSM